MHQAATLAAAQVLGRGNHEVAHVAAQALFAKLEELGFVVVPARTVAALEVAHAVSVESGQCCASEARAKLARVREIALEGIRANKNIAA
jgi:hypothetical protein